MEVNIVDLNKNLCLEKNGGEKMEVNIVDLNKNLCQELLQRNLKG